MSAGRRNTWLKRKVTAAGVRVPVSSPPVPYPVSIIPSVEMARIPAVSWPCQSRRRSPNPSMVQDGCDSGVAVTVAAAPLASAAAARTWKVWVVPLVRPLHHLKIRLIWRTEAGLDLLPHRVRRNHVPRRKAVFVVVTSYPPPRRVLPHQHDLPDPYRCGQVSRRIRGTGRGGHRRRPPRWSASRYCRRRRRSSPAP